MFTLLEKCLDISTCIISSKMKTFFSIYNLYVKGENLNNANHCMKISFYKATKTTQNFSILEANLQISKFEGCGLEKKMFFFLQQQKSVIYVNCKYIYFENNYL